MDLLNKIHLKTGRQFKVSHLKKMIGYKGRVKRVKGDLYHIKNEHYYTKIHNSSYVVYQNESDLCQSLVDDFLKKS